MDYKKMMESGPDEYNVYYDIIIIEIVNKALMNLNCKEDFHSRLIQALQSKRDFGLQKYGELSFQSNFVNSMKSPTLEHAKEEMLDFINYISHEVYKSKLLYSHYTLELESILDKGIRLYEDTLNLLKGGVDED